MNINSYNVLCVLLILNLRLKRIDRARVDIFMLLRLTRKNKKENKELKRLKKRKIKNIRAQVKTKTDWNDLSNLPPTSMILDSVKKIALFQSAIIRDSQYAKRRGRKRREEEKREKRAFHLRERNWIEFQAVSVKASLS